MFRHLKLFKQSNSDVESYGIHPEPVLNPTDQITDYFESISDDLFSPNKLVNCYINQAREERRFKLNEMEVQLKEELEQLRNLKPEKLTIQQKLSNLIARKLDAFGQDNQSQQWSIRTRC